MFVWPCTFSPPFQAVRPRIVWVVSDVDDSATDEGATNKARQAKHCIVDRKYEPQCYDESELAVRRSTNLYPKEPYPLDGHVHRSWLGPHLESWRCFPLLTYIESPCRRLA